MRPIPVMNVRNVHTRTLAADPAHVGALIDRLASPDDGLWPRRTWPAMQFDRLLSEGAVGGHGPIRYTVETYEPGQRIRFRFTAPRGFHGTHGFAVEPLDAGRTQLRHVLKMKTAGWAVLTWPLVFRPLHDALIEDALIEDALIEDALIEDALDQAQRSLGLATHPSPLSPRVKALRWVMSGGKTRPQSATQS